MKTPSAARWSIWDTESREAIPSRGSQDRCTVGSDLGGDAGVGAAEGASQGGRDQKGNCRLAHHGTRQERDVVKGHAE